MDRRRAAGALLALAACIACSTAAPMASSNQTALDVYDGATEGCYYNFQHYGEGDRIMTNEPCLNCTCHNRMLMCYLRVCPFTKPIGQDCTVEKRADQCCPIVTCPDVPVDLLTSTSTTSPAEYGATGVGKPDKYGCSINGRYFPEGSKVPPSPNKPCEHCYCIRNMTTCVMQECTLHVDGCIPIYHKDVCCPVRYSCDHPEDEIPLLDDMTTTVRPTPGFLLTTTTIAPVTQVSQDCVHDDQIFADGALIKTEKACEHCYCMKGDIVCVVQECGTPMENEGKNCTSLPPRHGQCCPDTYICEGDEPVTEQSPEVVSEGTTSTNPPRKGTEGSGYRNEPDEPYTDLPIFETTEAEGSGDDEPTVAVIEPETLKPEPQSPDLEDEMFLTTAKESEFKPHSSTAEPGLEQTKVPKSETSAEQSSIEYEQDIATESSKSDDEYGDKTLNKEEEMSHDKKEIPIPSQEPTMTTIISDSNEVSSSTESLTSREDSTAITTESSFRKEDNIPSLMEITTQGVVNDLSTEAILNEVKPTVDDVNIEKILISTEANTESVMVSSDSTIPHSQTEIDDKFKEATTEVSYTLDQKQDEKYITDESSYTSSSKPELPETTSLNPIENEIDEDLSAPFSSGRIPGEGDCLINGITYKNYTEVPSTNKCHTQCKCVSSVIRCIPTICSPPPEYSNMNNCQPIYDPTDSCCPTYICDHSKETVLPESHSQMSGTESPKPIHGIECSGDECKIIEDQEKLSPKLPEPCSSEKCMVDEKKTEATDCGTSNCAGNKDLATPLHPENPLNKDLPCDPSTGCQVTAIKPCDGNECNLQTDLDAEKEHKHCKNKEGCEDIEIQKPEDGTCKDGVCNPVISTEKEEDAFEKECNDDNCRRKETSTDTMEATACIGEKCNKPIEMDPVLNIPTTQVPLISEEPSKLSEKDFTTTLSEYSTIKPDEKLTSVFEDITTVSYDTSSKIVDINLQEYTTKYDEYSPPGTAASIMDETDLMTSKQPKVTDDINETNEPLEEITAVTSDGIEKEKEYSTTVTAILSTDSASAEHNTDEQNKEENILDVEKQVTESSKSSVEVTFVPTIQESNELTTLSSDDFTESPHYTLTDKDTNIPADVSDEKTAIIEDDDKNIIDTESSTTKDFNSEELKEKDLSTDSIASHDDHTTETLMSDVDKELTTKAPQYHIVEENLTESHIDDNMYTTQKNIEDSRQDEITTEISIENEITERSRIPNSPTESSESASTEAVPEDVTKERGDVSDDEREVNTYTTELDTDQHITTEKPVPVLHDKAIIEEVIGTEEPKHEEPLISPPLPDYGNMDKVTDTAESDQFVTEISTSDDSEAITESYLSEVHPTEVIGSGLDVSTDISSIDVSPTESDNTQKIIIDEIVPKAPSSDDSDIKSYTDSPTILTTEDSKIVDTSTDVVVDIDKNKVNTEIQEEFTTVTPSSIDHEDKNLDKEKGTKPIESTVKPEISETTYSVDLTTEAITDDNEFSTPKILSLLTTTNPHQILPHDQTIEISTSKTYEKHEDVTESFTENLSKSTEQTGGVQPSQDDNPITMTEYPVEVSTSSKDDSFTLRTTEFPETSDKQQTTAKEENEVTEPTQDLQTIKHDESLTSERSPITSSYESQVTTDQDDSEKTITSKPETVTSISDREDEVIVQATTLPQLDLTEEYTVHKEKEPSLVSQVPIEHVTMSTTDFTETDSKIADSEVQTNVGETHGEEEKYTETPFTETPDKNTEKYLSNTLLKDQSTKIPYLLSPETDVTETVSDTPDTVKTTLSSNVFEVTKDSSTENAEEITKGLEKHTDSNEKITETYLPDVTELPEKVTKGQDIPEVIFEEKVTTEKIMDDLEHFQQEQMKTETPEVSTKVTSDDLSTASVVVDTHKGDTTPETLHQGELTKTPEQGADEQLEGLNKFTEAPKDDDVTNTFATYGTEELPESSTIHDDVKTSAEVTKDSLSIIPAEEVTEIVKPTENIDMTEDKTNIPDVTDVPHSIVTDSHEINTILYDEPKPQEVSSEPTLDNVNEQEGYEKTTITSNIYVPIETTSQLPQNELITKEDSSQNTEKDIEGPIEGSVITSSKPLDAADVTDITENYESSPTHQPTGGSAEEELQPNEPSATKKPHESDIRKDFESTTISEAPLSEPGEQDIIQHSSSKPDQEDATQADTSSNTDRITEIITETSSEKLLETDTELTVTNSYTEEQFTQAPVKGSPDIQKLESPDYPSEEKEQNTQIPVTQKTNEQRLSTVIQQDLTTQKVQTETATNRVTYPELSGNAETTDNQIIETEIEHSTELPSVMSHVTEKESVEKQSESPLPSTTVKDEKFDAFPTLSYKPSSQTTDKPKQPDDTTTEKSELTTKLDSEKLDTDVYSTAIQDEITQLPVSTSKPRDEFLDSTPYFIELEEHTHKSVEKTTPEAYHEEEMSTVEITVAEKEEFDITTETQVVKDQGNYDFTKDTETVPERDTEASTISVIHEDLDKMYTTSFEDKSTEKSTQYDKHTTPSSTSTESDTEVTQQVIISDDKETFTSITDSTIIYDKQDTPKYEEQTTSQSSTEKEIVKATDKPQEVVTSAHVATAPEEEFIPAVTKSTTTKVVEVTTTSSPLLFDNITSPHIKPIENVSSSSPPELQKPGFNDVLPTDDLPSTDDDSHFPPTGSSGYGQEPDYGEEDQAFGPGTCRYGGKVYVSAQQIPRDDPCDFCFCFRSDIICLQQSCPPPIHGCHEEPIQGFCCPRYECPVSMATTLNVTTTTTTTTTTLPPHFLPHAYKGAAQRRGCQIKGHTYKVGEVVRASSGPCLHCTCGGDGQMKCDPKACTPEPMLRQMIAAAVSAKRRR